MKSKLWNRNFILAVVGMVISAAGDVGLTVALGVVVFQQTGSTMLTAVFGALSIIPRIILPLIIGPIVDRRNPLKVLVRNEIILAILFFATAIITIFWGFNYTLYLVFSLLLSCFGVISQIASSSVIPQIMEKEHYMRGYAVINVIYPLCSVLFSPVALFLFDKFGMPIILIAYGITTLIDAALESRIKVDFAFIKAKKTSIKEYGQDLASAFRYLREDKAILAVYFAFTLIMLSDCSTSVLMYPYFNTNPLLTNDHYALMLSIRSAGYLVGGLLHYVIKIPDNKRFMIAIFVYFCFILLEGPLYLMPFGFLCATRFILGILGMNSANIRSSSIQARVPATQRAKVNALFSIMTSAATFVGGLLVGALGEVFPYWTIQIGFQGFYLVAILFLILPKRFGVKKLYNFVTAKPEANSVTA
ncbi:MAG: MFS transporter [Clostridiales bacterium]|nr:MFS transporter [Clostridiales bacterium]